MIQIQKAQEQDIPYIALLWRDKLQAIWTEEMIRSSFKKEDVITLRAVSEDLLNRKQNCIGFLMASLEGDAELYALVIQKAHQRKGIGQRLLENLFVFLREKNIFSLFLEVAEDNREASLFYEKMGFQKVGERPCYYLKEQEGQNSLRVKALVLRKRL